jgi:tripartite-type tricarboxylate transporter receptor subunit TctC
VAILAMAGVCGVASAAEWPTKPITLIVPWSAGGGTDLTARLVFSYAEKILDQKVIIVNKPGAGSEIGLTELALAKPDGYTWGFTNSPIVEGIILSRDTKFTMESFEPCCNIVYDPGIIVVRTDSQFKSINEFIEYAKENPGVITVGNTGSGSDDDIVDCTYDDLPHEMSYKYFLKTDAEMKSFGRTWSFLDKASISFR